MAKIYANLIIAGRKSKDDIPQHIREDVGRILLGQGFITEVQFESEWAVKEVIG